MTLEQIRAAGGSGVDRAKVAATTEETIRQHMVEDGGDPGVSLPAYQPDPDAGGRTSIASPNPAAPQSTTRPCKLSAGAKATARSGKSSWPGTRTSHGSSSVPPSGSVMAWTCGSALSFR